MGTVIIPLLFNLGITALLLPSLIPESSSMTFPISENSMWSGLYYSYPYVYILYYLVIIGLYAGLYAVTGLVATKYFQKRLTILFAPFVGNLVFFLILNLFNLGAYAPAIFLRPEQPAPMELMEVLLLWVIIFAGELLLYRKSSKWSEVY